MTGGNPTNLEIAFQSRGGREGQDYIVAREFAFAEGKSPSFLQRISEEEEAREGEGAFSQVLGCFDVKDAFRQVPQEKPLKVTLRGEELWVNRISPGQGVGATAWFV